MQIDFQNSVRTVSQLTSEIKSLLERNYRFTSVSGEISNLKTPFSGHHYFTLKDSNAQIRAVMFKGQQRYLSEPLRDGQQVICRGRISVYEPRGEYQIIIDSIEQYGAGVLQARFETLKKKLLDEGLFDSNHKIEIPPFPAKIIVISSPTGAAIQDFLKICRQRKTTSHIQIFPVPVQGESAAGEIARAIDLVNHDIDCDVIVLCRGGGSIEDLWAFNEEIVARAIYRSKIPIITGIGHETDTTIADLVSDRRSPTPTGAAESIIPDVHRLEIQLQTARLRLKRIVTQHVALADKSVRQQTRLLANYRNIIEKLSFRVDLNIDTFEKISRTYFEKRQEKLNRLTSRLEHQAPLNQIELQQQQLRHLRSRLENSIFSGLNTNEERLKRVALLMQGVSPLSTLARGYSIVQKRDKNTGKLNTVTRSEQVDLGDELRVLLDKGKLYCEVKEKE
ncbi:exodeoxyribonuclease VII large subunit [Desulfosediminicola flagellatus]|uniref:exodeoxyribonuclease VII large subunit n=1 Tax=Desulfosediminicola flagellatus TaxID=2569541 RepID=UPI0010AC7F1E|nr:exodeoxyribonuclease VII large subunit [Desulfosediminicola flagellatus]